METVKQTENLAWGVFYHDVYKPELVGSYKTQDEAHSEMLEWRFNNEGDLNYYVDSIGEEDDTESDAARHFSHLAGEVSQAYDFDKLYIWKRLINDNLQPKEWGLPTPTGTRVMLVPIVDHEQRMAAIAEIREFVKEVNERYDTSIAVMKKNQWGKTID